MTFTQIIFQVLTAVLSIWAIFQKQKWKMMLIYTINNVLNAIMYLAFDRVASMVICFVATFRTAIFMIYALKKIKPNYLWLLVFEIGFIVSTILTWQDAYDLLPLFALIIVGYGSWQDNQLILRSSYVINKILYLIYKAIIGAYIAMAVEIVTLVFTIIGLVYYCFLKKETPIFDLIFKRKNKSVSDIESKEEADKTDAVETAEISHSNKA